MALPLLPNSQRSSLTSNRSRLRSALDNMGTNIFLADRNLKLVFINEKAKETLKSIEHVIREEFGVGVDDLLGMCIDDFHQNPDMQRRLLSNPKNLPHNAEIKLGLLTLDLMVAPVYSKTGKFVGTVVNWEDITEKKHLEAEGQKVNEMMRQNASECHALRLRFENCCT